MFSRTASGGLGLPPWKSHHHAGRRRGRKGKSVTITRGRSTARAASQHRRQKTSTYLQHPIDAADLSTIPAQYVVCYAPFSRTVSYSQRRLRTWLGKLLSDLANRAPWMELKEAQASAMRWSRAHPRSSSPPPRRMYVLKAQKTTPRIWSYSPSPAGSLQTSSRYATRPPTPVSGRC